MKCYLWFSGNVWCCATWSQILYSIRPVSSHSNTVSPCSIFRMKGLCGYSEHCPPNIQAGMKTEGALHQSCLPTHWASWQGRGNRSPASQSHTLEVLWASYPHMVPPEKFFFFSLVHLSWVITSCHGFLKGTCIFWGETIFRKHCGLAGWSEHRNIDILDISIGWSKDCFNESPNWMDYYHMFPRLQIFT